MDTVLSPPALPAAEQTAADAALKYGLLSDRLFKQASATYARAVNSKRGVTEADEDLHTALCFGGSRLEFVADDRWLEACRAPEGLFA